MAPRDGIDQPQVGDVETRRLRLAPGYAVNAADWIRAKSDFDQIGSDLWRVHDGLYDLTDFAGKHPGGPEWLTASRGTDITEAFEVCHVGASPASMAAVLKKYFVRPCNESRRSVFSFRDDGFYRTLRRRVKPVLDRVGYGPSFAMLVLQDSLVLAFHLLLLLTAWTGSLSASVATGIVLGMSTSCAHNFFHQKDNFRMYYWDLSMLSFRDWRVTHMLSHHLHTNTFVDVEIAGLLPILNFYPTHKKEFVYRVLSPIYVHVVYMVTFPEEYLKKMVHTLEARRKLRLEDTFPLWQLGLMLWWCDSNRLWVFGLWLIMHSMAGYWLIFTSIVTTHHHPEVYHAGDHPPWTTDWGLRQMDAVRDVDKAAWGGLFLVATTFGDHMLHHLFPTVDHSKLHFLYPALEETCQDFGVEYRFETVWRMLVGMHAQLARTRETTFAQRHRMRNEHL